MVLTGLVYYYSINYCFNSGSLEGKCWKDFHLFWWKIYSLTCLCIMFGTWAKRRMNVLGRENLRFSRWFSSIYVLCGSHIKHYFVETLVLRSSLPSNKSGFFFSQNIPWYIRKFLPAHYKLVNNNYFNFCKFLNLV